MTKTQKQLNAELKTPKNALGLTYKQFGLQVAKILRDNWNVDFNEVPMFNMYQHWEGNVTVNKTVKICMGVADSPFDRQYHPPIEFEFVDNYVAD